MLERAIRIKAVDDEVAQRCMVTVGGHIVLPKGKPPMFHFNNHIIYDEYCRLLRKARAQK